MIEQFDTIVIGAGIAGETCARRLRTRVKRVALVEREYMGGECAYWATIPTSTLMGPANIRWQAQAIAGVASPSIASPRTFAPPEILPAVLDEAAQVAAIEKQGGTYIRGDARFIAPGQIAVGERQLAAPHIVIATGSEPSIPEIPGLSDIGYWTNREATRAEGIPQGVVILGGGGQAVEIGQMFRLYGAEVTVVTDQDHLLMDEDPEIGKLLAQRMHGQGVRVVVGRKIVRLGRDADHACVASLEDGSEIHAQALVVATHRHPRTDGLDLEKAGVRSDAAGIKVDETCRAAPGVWAVGAVTGLGHLYHMAQYQARIAADDILGQPHPAHYESVPRVYFVDPQIAITGQTRTLGNGKPAPDIVSVAVDLREMKTHPTSAREPESGRLTLFADPTRNTLVGAWAAAAEASDWIELAIQAIRSEISLDVLRDLLEQYPTFGEAYLAAVDQLIAAVAQHTPSPASKR